MVEGGRREADDRELDPQEPVEGAEERREEPGAEAEDATAGLQARLGELEQQNLRLLADFDNFRRRQARAQEQARASLLEEVLSALLPLADDLARALEAAPGDDPLREGVAMVERSLQGILQRFGLQPIEAVGRPFDPALHEAVAQEESDLEPGTVTAELRRGYRIEDRVVRAAMVRVARARE